MSRNARQDIEGCHFHVMVQGIGREEVFPTDFFKGYYLKCLRLGKEKYPVKLLAFCVMGNHAHVLIKVENTSELSAYFRQVNSFYANYYNRMNDRVGYVFRGRFRSQLIGDIRHLCFCLAYIQNNPVKAGIVHRAEDYGYSSYTNYLTGTGIIDFDAAKEYFEVSPDGIRGIMRDCTGGDWLEHEEQKFEDKKAVWSELAKRYHVKENEKVMNIDLAVKITTEMQVRCNATMREMAQMLGVSRESLRKRIAWLEERRK
jgi:REP element-mobilizing transposase RayT